MTNKNIIAQPLSERLIPFVALDVRRFHAYDYARLFMSACTHIIRLKGTLEGMEDQGRLTRLAVAIDLLDKLLRYDHQERPTAKEAMKSLYCWNYCRSEKQKKSLSDFLNKWRTGGSKRLKINLEAEYSRQKKQKWDQQIKELMKPIRDVACIDSGQHKGVSKNHKMDVEACEYLKLTSSSSKLNGCNDRSMYERKIVALHILMKNLSQKNPKELIYAQEKVKGNVGLGRGFRGREKKLEKDGTYYFQGNKEKLN
ncbi:hypothetical protein Tco_1563220 [Tanacetum coccineum]